MANFHKVNCDIYSEFGDENIVGEVSKFSLVTGYM